MGEIGTRLTKSILTRTGYRLIGAVDRDLSLVGRDIGELLGEGTIGISVDSDPAEPLSRNPDLVIHSTRSHLPDIAGQLESCLECGCDVISTAEELSYPYLQHPDLAENLDGTARQSGTTLFGTGINPGFVMDLFPFMCTAPCRKLTELQVERWQDASKRRKALQRKIGVGLAEEDFTREVIEKGGHVGLPESLALIAEGLNLKLKSIRQHVEPVVAPDTIESEYYQVSEGEIRGMLQVGHALTENGPDIQLKLKMALELQAPHDLVRVRGSDNYEVVIPGGLHGDRATPAVVLNYAPTVLASSPGLKTWLGLPAPGYTSRARKGVRLNSGVSIERT